MDELQKTEARNYLTAAGLLLFALIPLLPNLGAGQVGIEALSMTFLIGGVMLLVTGIVLLVLRKRDIAGISFIISGMVDTTAGFVMLSSGPGVPGMLTIAAIVRLIWGIILLFSKDDQKWVFAVISIIFGGESLLKLFLDPAVGTVTSLVCLIIIIVIAAYFALAAGFERISLPGRRLITADETTEFKQSGSAIGYIIFAGIAVTYLLMYLGVPTLSANTDAVHAICLSLGAMLILIGILLFAIGKMRFTPVMFILIGISEMLTGFSSGAMIYALGALVVITGIFAMLRKESRILPGLMIIIYGASYFISALVSGTAVSPVASVLLNIIPAAIAVYLAVATLSQRKIPLF